MFARNVSIRLKPNSSAAFTKQIENETIPTLRKQKGFQGEITLLAPGGGEAVGGCAWTWLRAAIAAGSTSRAAPRRIVRVLISRKRILSLPAPGSSTT